MSRHLDVRKRVKIRTEINWPWLKTTTTADRPTDPSGFERLRKKNILLKVKALKNEKQQQRREKKIC